MKIREYMTEKSFWDLYPDYQVREVKKDRYQVTKWTHGKQPVEVYNISYNVGGAKMWICDCPANPPCKHVEMVKQWIKDGKPVLGKMNMDDLQKLMKSKDFSS